MRDAQFFQRAFPGWIRILQETASLSARLRHFRLHRRSRFSVSDGIQASRMNLPLS